MIFNIDKKGTQEGLDEVVQSTLKNSGVKSLMILSCDGNNLTPETTDPLLKSISIPVFGGIFPSIIFQKEKLEMGTVVVGLPLTIDIVTIDRLSDSETDFIGQIDKKAKELNKFNTIFVFVDGFSIRISSFINSLFSVFGLESNYIGGGAGSLDMMSKPCLFTNQGLIQDSAILAFLKLSSGVGVNHGWKSVSGPYRVTESDHNIIKTLDWTPAFEVYRDAIQEHSNQQISKDNFFDIAKAYPFGIAKLGAERVVRDPIQAQDDNTIMCVGEVPEGSFVDILNGNVDSLIEAAGKAKQLSSRASRHLTNPGMIFFIDCISRVLFLESKFSDEINAVFSNDLPLVGACTIGEIANSGNEFLEFYNKTSVVGIIEDA